MSRDWKFTLVCLAASAVFIAMIGVFESPTAAATTAFAVSFGTLLGLLLGRLIRYFTRVRRRRSGVLESGPSLHPTRWYVRLGALMGIALALGSVGLSIASGARANDAATVVAAALPLLLVMPLAMWLMGWWANRRQN